MSPLPATPTHAGEGRQRLRRREDWPGRLERLLAARRAQPFAWGAHDCCLFAADAVLAMTGADPAAGFRGRYASATGAARVLRRYGGLEGAVARLARAHGMPAIAPLAAARGDVVLLMDPARSEGTGLQVQQRTYSTQGAVPDNGPGAAYTPQGGPALGVVTGRGEIAAAGPHGLVFVALRAASRAWRV